MNGNFLHHTLSGEEVLTWRHFLTHFSLEFIHQQIENYKTCCLNYPTNEILISKAVDSLLAIDYQGHRFQPPFKDMTNFEKERNLGYFFRVREIDGMWWSNGENIDFNTFELKDIQTLQDVWERPAEDVKYYGRLNKPNSSVLYTALEPSTAIRETIIPKYGVKDTPPFILTVYKCKESFTYSDCLHFIYYDGLTDEENTKRYLLFNLLRNEFTRIRPALYDNQNQYCASYFISNKFFIHEDSQAIYYPSTRGLGSGNVVFLGNFREYLEFVGFFFFIDGKPLLGCSWDSEKERFNYFSLGSDDAKQVFGDPILQVLLRK